MHTQTHTATTTTTTISEYTTRISDNTWNFVTDEPAREFIIFHWVQRHRKKMYIYSYIKAIKKSENKYCLGENKNPSGQCMTEKRKRKRNWNKHFSWIIVFSIHIWMGECISLNLTFWCGLSLSLYIARESFCHVDFVDKTACYIFHGLALSCVCVFRFSWHRAQTLSERPNGSYDVWVSDYMTYLLAQFSVADIAFRPDEYVVCKFVC